MNVRSHARDFTSLDRQAHNLFAVGLYRIVRVQGTETADGPRLGNGDAETDHSRERDHLMLPSWSAWDSRTRSLDGMARIASSAR